MRPEPTGRRAPRSRDDIAEAAVAVADAEGLEAVSMRRVASELGLGTMSLYHYVRSKDELLDLMGDAIMGGQLVDEAELQKGWRAGLTAIAQATRAQLRAPPGWATRCARGPRRSRDPTRCATSSSRWPPSPTPASTRRPDGDHRARRRLRLRLRHARRCVAELEEQRERSRARSGWQAVFELHARRSSRAAPTPTSAPRARGQPRGGRPATRTWRGWRLDEGRFERGLERLLDGIEVELKRRRGR